MTVGDAAAPPRARRSRGRGAGERSEPLGNERAQLFTARRNEAWALRRRLWEVSSLPRVRACGRVPRAEGGVVLRLTGGASGRAAGFAGLVHCGSPWSCPTCARKIGARRAEEIRAVVEAAGAAGGQAALVTLTLRHHRGHSLADGWDALRYAWSRVTSGKAYQTERERFGIEGWCCAVEVTHGEHGWHPHAHILVIFDGPVSAEMTAQLGVRWFVRWERALARRGFSALYDGGGLDTRLVAMTADSPGALGQYLSKITHEVTGGYVKDGRYGNRSPFAVLRDGLATGLADDLDLWWEFECVAWSRRQLTWSGGLRRRHGLGPEQSDDEIADEDVGTEDVIALPVDTWAAIRDRAEALLTAAEDHGLPGAVAWLDTRGLAWRLATPAPRRAPIHNRGPRTTTTREEPPCPPP